MAITGLGNYGNIYGSMYASEPKGAVSGKNCSSKVSETQEEDIQEYQKRLQSKVKDVTLETGTSLNMKKDNKIGTVTIHPELLKKMQNNPEAEKKYTQLIKDIERAEQTVGAYYNAIGGVVERSSHWYIDENGEYCHFGYVRRDDKLNKKLREESQKNSEKLIEKTKEKTAKKQKEFQEKLEEKRTDKDYVNELTKLAPSVEFNVGSSYQTAKNGKTLTISPQLLEKMQNNPEQEKETKEMIKGVESMTKLMDGINKASGWTVVYRHSYIDENGKYRAIAYVRNDFMLNMSDKLREERRKNSEKLIEKTKEKAEEKSAYDKVEQLINEKVAASKDGMIYLNDTDFRTIIEAAQEDGAGKTTVKEQTQVGANLDLKIMAFTKLAEDKEMQPVTSDKSVDGDVYSKEKEPSAKLYTSSGTLQGKNTKKSKSQYSENEILEEIEAYAKAGDAYVIWHSGNKHWLQGTKNGEAVGDKKYFDLDSLNTALGKNSQKKVSVVDNTVLFENNSYYKFTGKDGKEHTILSLGSALHTGLFGDKTYDKKAADYVDFWNGLSGKTPSGISIKFSNGEIRSRLADAGIQSGFFTVTVGARTATHYLSQGKNTVAVHSKEQYDERYNRMTSGEFFDQFQAGQKVTVGGKEYVLGEDKKLDIEYGADIFDLHAQAPESMREA